MNMPPIEQEMLDLNWFAIDQETSSLDFQRRIDFSRMRHRNV
jgi:hypothetical protein